MAGKRTPARMARLVARWRESGESRSSFTSGRYRTSRGRGSGAIYDIGMERLSARSSSDSSGPPTGLSRSLLWRATGRAASS